MTLTFGSLFAGIGGFDLGLERAGMVCKWQVEIDEYARRVLAKHWPVVRRHDDVRTFPPSCGLCFQCAGKSGEAAGAGCACAARDWSVDLIAGGDPCQENSRARITPGTRAPSLGAEFVRVVAALRPLLVLRENPSRIRRNAPWPWWRFRDSLEELGYLVLPLRVRSCCLGAFHQRERLFVLGAMPDSDERWLRLRGRAATDGTPQGGEGTDGERQRLRPDVRAVGGGDALHASRERLAWLDGEGVETEHAGGTVGGDVRPERRDDGLPAPQICRSRHEVPYFVDRIRGLGNAVDPVVAEWIGRRILASSVESQTGGTR